MAEFAAPHAVEKALLTACDEAQHRVVAARATQASRRSREILRRRVEHGRGIEAVVNVDVTVDEDHG